MSVKKVVKLHMQELLLHMQGSKWLDDIIGPTNSKPCVPSSVAEKDIPQYAEGDDNFGHQLPSTERSWQSPQFGLPLHDYMCKSLTQTIIVCMIQMWEIFPLLPKRNIQVWNVPLNISMLTQQSHQQSPENHCTSTKPRKRVPAFFGCKFGYQACGKRLVHHSRNVCSFGASEIRITLHGGPWNTLF